MVNQLPQSCRFVVYAHLDARDLFRLRGVCKTTRDTIEHPYVWKRMFAADLFTLVTESNQEQPTAYQSIVTSIRQACGFSFTDEMKWSLSPMRWTTWPLMYRACAKKLHYLRRDVTRLVAELDEIQSLRRERGHLKDMTQVRGKRTGTEMRRNQLSCVKYINKSTRRLWVADHSVPTLVTSKSDLLQRLQTVDTALKDSTATTFTLRTQLRKEHRKVLGLIAAARAQVRTVLVHECQDSVAPVASVQFYEALLGAEHLYKDDKDFGFDPAFLRVGSAQVALLPLEPTQAPIQDHNGAHFAITCTDEADFLAIKASLSDDLKRAGGPIAAVDFFDYGRYCPNSFIVL
ncbi:hypothetical protein DYB30_009363 [Aphanomyces astaci]|uniref:F-box domain-containing protein n=1 Tax=Aphanomyces astaci TaxID=112090 RepID=A0A397DKB1_APHAT|nr:hypothetical protein DYB30_009363 [Aphanomyces astaci]RHY95846.1 hypothetical protein DYB26_012682 [Aphanomyces astaci]